MGRTAASARALTALTALLLVTACVPGLGDDEPPPAPGKGQLDEAKLSQVLPHDDQIPQGFSRASEEEDEDESDPEATAYPSTCLDLRLAGPTATAYKEHTTAKSSASFEGSDGGYLEVTVSSHDEAVPAKLFDDAGAAQGSCATSDLIDKEGTTSWELSPTTFPQLGDRTYSARVKMTSGDELFTGGTVQIAGVAVGHNLVYVVYSAGPKSRYEPSAVENFAKATATNLDAL